MNPTIPELRDKIIEFLQRPVLNAPCGGILDVMLIVIVYGSLLVHPEGYRPYHEYRIGDLSHSCIGYSLNQSPRIRRGALFYLMGNFYPSSFNFYPAV
jgi:hypothetical protein